MMAKGKSGQFKNTAGNVRQNYLVYNLPQQQQQKEQQQQQTSPATTKHTEV
jgi:hypothetical protein